ncbi:MAG: hypothetical protein JSS02_02350 [Planctomycetes bacterium]|nr:hypothetical protein [Planctomycetota bacterium]
MRQNDSPVVTGVPHSPGVRCVIRRGRVLAGIVVALSLLLLRTALAAEGAAEFQAELKRQVEAAEKAEQLARLGTDDRMFFISELRTLSVGPFWGEQAVRVSRASKPEYADPVPAIVDFAQQLRGAGIDLLLVPVPAKAAVYPESAVPGWRPAEADAPVRVDTSQQEFYRLLERQQVSVLDLMPVFWKERHRPAGDLYCQTDTHWSGRGLELAARAIAERVAGADWLPAKPQIRCETRAREVEITGDLARMLNEQKPVRETIRIQAVGTPANGELVPVPLDRDSPVLLIGDSHTLIFHDPELFARGAGLPDHLARELGVAVDLVGVRGSGGTSPRIELLRRKDRLAGKKLVIWCFSVREFTESTTGWRKVPVMR